MEKYINDKKDFYAATIEFLDCSDENHDFEEIFQKLTNNFQNQVNGADHSDMLEFLRMINCISEHHYREPNFTIHSKYADLIHLLESNGISPSDNNNNDYFQYFIESIKCNHNDFADYIKDNFLDQNYLKYSKTKEKFFFQTASNIIIIHILK